MKLIDAVAFLVDWYAIEMKNRHIPWARYIVVWCFLLSEWIFYCCWKSVLSICIELVNNNHIGATPALPMRSESQKSSLDVDAGHGIFTRCMTKLCWSAPSGSRKCHSGTMTCHNLVFRDLELLSEYLCFFWRCRMNWRVDDDYINDYWRKDTWCTYVRLLCYPARHDKASTPTSRGHGLLHRCS